MFRIALAQCNTTVGDVPGNALKIAGAMRQAEAWRADLVLVPELAITGYPPEDLLLKPSFLAQQAEAVARLATLSRRTLAGIGFVDRDKAGRLYNAVAVLGHGRRQAVYRKQCLPNYGVFDEKRYFAPGTQALITDCGGLRIGWTICEDLWEAWPLAELAKAGVGLAVNVSASPYHAGKRREREALFSARARRHGIALAYCNLVGGQDELVFDGGSLVVDPRGRVTASAAEFREDMLVADIPVTPRRSAGNAVRIPCAPLPRPEIPARSRQALEPVGEVYEALALGLRDYVRKNGFTTVVLGLSGGVDSALTACIAADALGAEHVVALVMPSRYSSATTQEDARRMAAALGIRHATVPIDTVVTAYLERVRELSRALGLSLGPDGAVGLTEQNLQARARGNLLMALSNLAGWIVLTTGNKSETATGYTTLYGDMAGGFAVIKDVPKTLVWELARFRNRRGPGSPIPQSIIDRPPTAELAPGQLDQDTLPPYPELDRILKAYVEEDRSLAEIVRTLRIPEQTAQRVMRMVDRSEYKRRQAPPGVKITPRAFGKDRRMPITNRFGLS